MKKYEGLDELVEEINNWHKGELEKESIRTRLDNVHNLVADILEVDDRIEELKELDIVIELAEDVGGLIDSYNKVQDNKQRLHQIRYELKKGNKELEGLKELSVIENLVGIIENTMGKYEEVSKRWADIAIIIEDIGHIEISIPTYDKQIHCLEKDKKEKEDEYEKILKDMKACPFCKRPITVEVSKKLTANL